MNNNLCLSKLNMYLNYVSLSIIKFMVFVKNIIITIMHVTEYKKAVSHRNLRYKNVLVATQGK